MDPLKSFASLRLRLIEARRPSTPRSLSDRAARAATIGIDQSVSLAALDLLAGVIPAWPAGLGGRCTLRIDHGGTWTGLTACPLASQHYQVMVQAFPGTVVAEAGNPAVDVWCGGSRVGSMRQGTPQRSMKNMALSAASINQNVARTTKR
jgi:hypothetical protein